MHSAFISLSPVYQWWLTGRATSWSQCGAVLVGAGQDSERHCPWNGLSSLSWHLSQGSQFQSMSLLCSPFFTANCTINSCSSSSIPVYIACWWKRIVYYSCISTADCTINSSSSCIPALLNLQNDLLSSRISLGRLEPYWLANVLSSLMMKACVWLYA